MQEKTFFWQEHNRLRNRRFPKTNSNAVSGDLPNCMIPRKDADPGGRREKYLSHIIHLRKLERDSQTSEEDGNLGAGLGEGIDLHRRRLRASGQALKRLRNPPQGLLPSSLHISLLPPPSSDLTSPATGNRNDAKNNSRKIGKLSIQPLRFINLYKILPEALLILKYF